jgi:hypothetical protein
MPLPLSQGVAADKITSTTNNVTSHLSMIELYMWSTPNGRKVSIMPGSAPGRPWCAAWRSRR